MGWPIVGDAIYGNAPRSGGPVLHLHAREVVVPLYKNRAPIRVVAPVPSHMGGALEQCRVARTEDSRRFGPRKRGAESSRRARRLSWPLRAPGDDYHRINCRSSCPDCGRDRARRRARDLREVLGAAALLRLDQHAAALRRLRHRDELPQRAHAVLAQTRRARSFTIARSSCGMRAAGVPGRGENGNTCRCVRPHSARRASSERRNISSVSVGKPAMRSAPNTMSGRSRRDRVAERDRVGPRMPALHALEDQIVAGLQRQMQMRHQPAFAGKGVDQIAIGLDRIDRGQAQSLELRHVLEDLLDQRAELRRARQIGAIARDVDAGEHDFASSRWRRAAARRRRRRPSAPSANCRGRRE